MDFEIFDERFRTILRPDSNLEKLATGATWSEGPAYLEAEDAVVWSDIPGNRLLKYSHQHGLSEFLKPSHFQNGHTFDLEGRLVGCSHGERAVVRLEHDGTWTNLVGHHAGKRLNSPNDIVVKSDGAIWFTDPDYGLIQAHEGYGGTQEQDGCYVYRFDPITLEIAAVITDMPKPNGLAFSPDEKKLYVVEWKGTPNRSIWSYPVNADGTLGTRTKLIDAADQGALDGFKVDRDGNLWCGWGSNGALQPDPTDVGGRKVFQLKGKSEDLDGVMVFNPEGKPLAFIRLPERCANLTFGGPKNTRLYMTSCHSVYALYVEAHGAV